VLGKGRRPRALPIGRKTAQALDRYLRAREGHRRAHLPHLWVGRNRPMTPSGIYQVVHDRAAGLPAIHPHQLRHAFATSWLAEGGNKNELMLVAGWKSRIMIDRYTKATAVERAMLACHQATGCRSRSSAIRCSCQSKMTWNSERGASAEASVWQCLQPLLLMLRRWAAQPMSGEDRRAGGRDTGQERTDAADEQRRAGCAVSVLGESVVSNAPSAAAWTVAMIDALMSAPVTASMTLSYRQRASLISVRSSPSEPISCLGMGEDSMCSFMPTGWRWREQPSGREATADAACPPELRHLYAAASQVRHSRRVLYEDWRRRSPPDHLCASDQRCGAR
jgi:hypothetical protein